MNDTSSLMSRYMYVKESVYISVYILLCSDVNHVPLIIWTETLGEKVSLLLVVCAADTAQQFQGDWLAREHPLFRGIATCSHVAIRLHKVCITEKITESLKSRLKGGLACKDSTGKRVSTWQTLLITFSAAEIFLYLKSSFFCFFYFNGAWGLGVLSIFRF